jgi:predicted O-methyltransferase YrrM
MSMFDRFRKTAPPLTPAAGGGPAPMPVPRKLFESQSRDGLISVSRSEHQQLQEHFATARARFPGPVYLEWLQFLHGFVEPRNYLEIGVETGASLAFARASTLAVGVDPSLEIRHALKARHKLFHLTSDEFFETQDMAAVFEGEPIVMAFIDGMHTFDQALRDFINVERHAARHSIVMFHDIFPVEPVTATRERRSVFWCGDTWKAICVLKKFRPELKIFTIPTHPSGLALVTHLDPASTVLADRFDELFAEAMDYRFEAFSPDLGRHLNETKNDPATVVGILNG